MGHGGQRAHDAEAKILEQIAAHLRAMPEEAEIKGFIVIGANKPMCPACKDATHRFAGEFGDKITVVVEN